MREPVLYNKLRNKLSNPIVDVVVEKEKQKDREVYLRVEPSYYLIVFVKHGEVIGERVLATITKTVRKKGRTYNYTYLRIILPWSNVLKQKEDRIELTIRVYRLDERIGEREYYKYLQQQRERYAVYNIRI